MARHYSHRSSGDHAKNRHHEGRCDRRNDYYEPTRPTRRQPSGGDYWSQYASSGSYSSRRSSGGSSRRQSASGGFLARRSVAGTSLSRYSSPMSSIDEIRCSDWELDMEWYFDSLRQGPGGQRGLDPIVDHPDVRHDRQRRGYLHRSEYVANQFDVTLRHVRDLLHHMHDHYDTVTCYSMGLLKAGDIIYYIEPFVLGFDQMDEGEAIQVLGGTRFQAAVQAKGRFGIVTHVIGRQTLKVAPMYTFNGDGLASKPPSVRDDYIELGLHGRLCCAPGDEQGDIDLADLDSGFYHASFSGLVEECHSSCRGKCWMVAGKAQRIVKWQEGQVNVEGRTGRDG
ncbi:uncharacterized protein CC84DRAFT_1180967 [Paraphaeosphaeria sporulosa]|uniref:Uncharacterized protein n=1 Tax=Paraphaeosphaeria sporulosa TaxID=1460663 RepID=A0A177BZM7_9PLEO|nr:uncharacterized protein CC84DRAFT_1180967 [Paraphaeosphaeria sporulosa]OAG00169.1 hypothetical protein CC84DRAFT_1180967 [Paraphaeosphaeria sporulosa]